MKKQLMIFLLALLPIMAMADKKGKYGEGIKWAYTEATHTLTISGAGAMKNDYKKPWEKFIRDIRTVNIEDGVTNISNWAFSGCSNLTSVNIPNSVTTIGWNAFKDCTSLVSVNIPNGVTSIGSSAFSGCSSLTSVDIPNSVVSIEGGAFQSCKSLKAISIPNSVKSIGSYAFCFCESLTSIVIPMGVSSIEQNTFSHCKNLTSVTIPLSVIKVEKEAFAECEKLKVVNIPNKRAIIDQYAGRSKGFCKSNTFVLHNDGSTKESAPLVAQSAPTPVEVKKQEPMQQSVVASQPQSVATPQLTKEQITNVDRNIFVSKTVDKNTFAVIIGNEKYEDEGNVPYAENDAKIFGEYCQKTLGISEKHIRLITNAGYNDIRKAVSWLKQGMEAYGGNGRVVFYYAGHGIPNETDKSAYLLPVDGIGSDIESAYSLNKLYQSLSELPAQSVTVFLDACFSGTKREGGMMVSARGVAIKAKPAEAKGKMVVFTAAQGDETAYPFKSQQHGMFTYYLLKKLQETKGNVTLGELGDYLRQEVKRESFDENNKIQTPTINASASLADSWRQMKLKE